MRHFLILLISLFLAATGTAQPKTADELLDAMYKRYSGKICKTMTFSQLTYRPNDSLNTHMIWYEAIDYPDQLRIDFNSTTKGNAAIFRNDSVFQFRKGAIYTVKPDKNDLLLLLGGMYFRPFDEVLRRLAGLGYDMGRFSENTWKATPVYVIGALPGDTISNQIWVDKSGFRIVRTLSRLSASEELDMHCEAPVKACDGFIESKLSFYINGRLDQQEEYKELNPNVKLDPAVFDPAQFGKVHWRKSNPPVKSPPKH